MKEDQMKEDQMKEDFGKMIKDTDHQVTQVKWGTPQSLPVVGVCKFCGRKFSVHEFRDAASLEEFIISGLCQECQDKTFEEGK
jgi:hypothetical protein